MTLIELTLKTAISEAGEFKDVRLSKEDAEYLLSLLKKQEKRINELEEKLRTLDYGYTDVDELARSYME